MRILFLGGTSFVGRHIARAVLAAGHAVTFFNRGVTDRALFAGQPHLAGDRDGDVTALATAEVDVVIDTSGYTPSAVRASAAAVAQTVRRYVFVSSIDVYDLSAPSVDESSVTRALPPGAQIQTRDPELYGAHKAQCEADLCAALGERRVTIVRAGLMAGPYDATDRFTYWPVRVAQGGDVLAPRSPELPVQFIDVRDVAQWIVGALERDLAGTYNLVGTPGSVTLGDVLTCCRDVSGSDARFTWVSDAFLLAHDVGPWVEMPLWAPQLPELRALCAVSNAAARATGLRLRPLAETVEDTLAEARTRDASRPLSAGLSAEREGALLHDWRTVSRLTNR